MNTAQLIMLTLSGCLMVLAVLGAFLIGWIAMNTAQLIMLTLSGCLMVLAVLGAFLIGWDEYNKTKKVRERISRIG